MARRVTRPTTTTAATTGTQKAITVEKTGVKDFFASVRDTLTSERFRLASGIILASIVLMLIVAYFSFFFHGAEDQSIVKHIGDRSEQRGEIKNALGLPGAIVADWLVDGTFGLVSIAALIALALYAARMIVNFPLKRIKLLFITLFSIIWGSIALGFAQQIIRVGSYFRWGGKVGELIAVWGMSYVQWLGMLVILIVSIILFLIVVDKHFVDHCQLIGQKIASLFRKKQEDTEEYLEDETALEGDEDDTHTFEIDLADKEGDEIVDIENNEETLNVEIDTPVNEEEADPQPLPEEDEEEENKDNDDIDVSVEDIKEVELSEDDPEFLLRKLGPYDPLKDFENYKLPSLNLLKV